jgi:hypothetical protein
MAADGFPRIATFDTELGGTKIFKGMVVRPSPQAANYDPDVFPDPLRFDIHRHPKRILAFGAGPHHTACDHPKDCRRGYHYRQTAGRGPAVRGARHRTRR